MPSFPWLITAPAMLACLTHLIAADPNSTPVSPWPLQDKTLVVWASPANLTQRGGSVLTLEKPGAIFDAIVLGELAPATWMAGSDGFRRTQREQGDFPRETVANPPWVRVAIVYHGRQITIHHHHQPPVTYAVDEVEPFPANSMVLLGLRHLDADADHRFFTGAIDDARIYAGALSAEQIAALQPNRPSDPAPLAWWNFEDGTFSDQMKTFPTTTLFNGARLDQGRLQLDHPGAFLLATTETLESRRTIDSADATDRSARALRERLLGDPHRPGYHFVIPEGRAMPFDPNGAIFWKGRYHLFYIFQDHRGHNWGHVSSTDLLHWRHHPTGLVDGMFSGNCFVNREGRPTMCYHQVGQGNAMAVALDDELNTWEKLASNPITPTTQPGDPFHDQYRSWDPFGWLEGHTYYAIFGGEHPGVVKAPSLAGKWQYVGDLLAHAAPGVALNEDVSCADFFKLGNRHVLVCISHRLGARYYLGDWKDEQFHPTSHERMSWVDNSFFAPETLLDDRGRRILWAWIFDQPQFKMRTDYGWSGTMSLPRVLTLADDGTLRMNPPEEIERLRQPGQRLTQLEVPADGDWTVTGVAGNSLELHVELEAPGATQYGVKVGCSPDGAEQTLVYYDAVEHKLKIDTTRASLTEGPKSVEAGPLALEPGEALKLRIFVDKSVIEVFANEGRQAVMRRVYPSRSDSVGVRLFSNGAPARAGVLEAWELAPSNPF